jgi:hypothetical protein
MKKFNSNNKNPEQEYDALGQPVTTKYKIINFSLAALFLIGITLTVFEINLYRVTIIPLIIPTCIWLISGLAFTPLTSGLLVKYFGTAPYFLRLFFNIIAFGGITVYIFIACNYYISSDNTLHTIKTPILKTGYLAKGRYGCGNPYADVNINGAAKQLIFPCDIIIEEYRYIDLTIRKGLWGFEIIENQTAVKY